jgi:hypothetical protein
MQRHNPKGRRSMSDRKWHYVRTRDGSIDMIPVLPPEYLNPEHACCHHANAAKAVLADRERELLGLKGPCSAKGCRLHYAHSGPCDMRLDGTR